MPEKPILYVEDDENDILLVECAFKKARLTNPLRTVRDGDQALSYLKGDKDYRNRDQHPLPGLVLLDLNLPRRSGMKVLQWIREQAQFATLPVVIYTSSEDPGDKETAKKLGANDYIIKPSLIHEITTIVSKLKERWLHHS